MSSHGLSSGNVERRQEVKKKKGRERDRGGKERERELEMFLNCTIKQK
jgi:hypothetical protein